MIIPDNIEQDVLDSIIKKSMVGVSSQQSIDVIANKSTVKISNSITSLQNAFNNIYAYAQNVKNIQKLEEKRLLNIKKEVTMETKTSSGSFAGSSALDIGNLPDVFRQLTTYIEELTETLDELNMSTCDSQGSDIDIDIDKNKKKTRGPRGRLRGMLPKVALGALAAGAAVVGGAMLFNRASSNKSNRQLEQVANNAARQQAKLDKGKPISDTSFSARFSDFIRQSISNISSMVGFGGSGGSFGGGGASGSYEGGIENPGVLDAIAKAEGTYETGYNTSLGYGKYLPQGKELNLTNMTLDQIGQIGNYMRKQEGNPNSSALGRYQIVNSTMFDAAAALKMDPSTTKFDAATQDKMAMWIVGKQGLGAWEGFKKNPQLRASAQTALSSGVTGKTDTSKGGVGQAGSGYGMRRHPILGIMKMHTGLDIKAPMGTPVYAAQSGTITFAAFKGDNGNLVKIKHGSDDATAYAHLSKIFVPAGASVVKGQLIGEVGSTGRSTGPHLHFEFTKGGNRIDPKALYDNNKWIVGGEKVDTGKKIGPTPGRASATPTILLPNSPARIPPVISTPGPSKGNAKRPLTHREAFLAIQLK